MWLTDALIVLVVIVVVTTATATVVWTDRRLDRTRPGARGEGGAADGDAATPRISHAP